MKVALTIFISASLGLLAGIGVQSRMNQAQTQASLDPDYCSGIACTEETDTCCDESLK